MEIITKQETQNKQTGCPHWLIRICLILVLPAFKVGNCACKETGEESWDLHFDHFFNTKRLHFLSSNIRAGKSPVLKTMAAIH